MLVPRMVHHRAVELLEAARLLRHWKYWTLSEPWATACSETSSCIPGRLSLATGCQLVMLGELSMRRKGRRFSDRLRSWRKAMFAASRSSRPDGSHSAQGRVIGPRPCQQG
jgi:hypothetical protein